MQNLYNTFQTPYTVNTISCKPNRLSKIAQHKNYITRIELHRLVPYLFKKTILEKIIKVLVILFHRNFLTKKLIFIKPFLFFFLYQHLAHTRIIIPISKI